MIKHSHFRIGSFRGCSLCALSLAAGDLSEYREFHLDSNLHGLAKQAGMYSGRGEGHPSTAGGNPRTFLARRVGRFRQGYRVPVFEWRIVFA